MMRIKKVSSLFFLLSLLCVSLFTGQEKEDTSLRLQIGDERYKDKVMEIFQGKLYSVPLGREIPFSQMIKEMEECRLVYVGESHDSLPIHEVQLRIIQALSSADGHLSIGLEMFPVTLQEVLNKWSLGILSRQEFLEESEWYVTWNFHFGFYENIFEFAKANRIPLYGLNVPREIIRKIRMEGWDDLGDEEKKLVPQPDLTNEDHRTLVRTIFESTELPPQMKGRGVDMAFEGLYRAQSAWDEVMAFNALEAMKKDQRKMVVLAGSGHLLYNLGINRRAYERSKLPFKTVISIPVPLGGEGVKVTRSIADYVFGIQAEEKPVYPSVGLSVKKFEGLENLVIERGPTEGVAKGQDFKQGDVILSVDGKAFYEINTLRMYLAQFTWGDEVVFRMLRSAQEREVKLKFVLLEGKK